MNHRHLALGTYQVDLQRPVIDHFFRFLTVRRSFWPLHSFWLNQYRYLARCGYVEQECVVLFSSPQA